MKTEDYLETIFKLKEKKGFIRISDIADEMNISKPSVTQMVQRLAENGYLNYEPYQPITLTKEGEKVGAKVAERHQVLEEFLTLLKIPKKIQEKDIHGIEHHLSPITLSELKKLNQFLKKKKY